MTHEEAQHKLFAMLESETGAMVPVGKVDRLLTEIFKDFENQNADLAEVSSENKPVNNVNYGGTSV